MSGKGRLRGGLIYVCHIKVWISQKYRRDVFWLDQWRRPRNLDEETLWLGCKASHRAVLSFIRWPGIWRNLYKNDNGSAEMRNSLVLLLQVYSRCTLRADAASLSTQQKIPDDDLAFNFFACMCEGRFCYWHPFAIVYLRICLYPYCSYKKSHWCSISGRKCGNVCIYLSVARLMALYKQKQCSGELHFSGLNKFQVTLKHHYLRILIVAWGKAVKIKDFCEHCNRDGFWVVKGRGNKNNIEALSSTRNFSWC